MSEMGVRRDKAALFPWVLGPDIRVDRLEQVLAKIEEKP